MINMLKKKIFVTFVLLSVSFTALAADSAPVSLGRDSADLLEVLSHCVDQFGQTMSVGHRVSSITVEQTDDLTKVYTIIVQAGGYLGGVPLHDVAALRIFKTRIPDPVFVPSKPTTYKYGCDVSNLVE